MAFASMLRADPTHTEGYGNTRDSLAASQDRYDDNEICEGDFKATLTRILSDKDRKRAGQQLNRFWAKYLSHFKSGSAQWHAGQNRLFAMLSSVTCGKIENWLGYLAA